MLTSILPEVNLHAGKKVYKQEIHPDIETKGRRHQKSKTGVSVTTRKGLMSSKNLKKKYFHILPAFEAQWGKLCDQNLI